MNFMDVLGLIGAGIVTYSNLPQIILFFRQGHANGISLTSTWLGTLGLVLRFIYLAHTAGWNMIVLGPYIFAILCCLITLYYCHFPKQLRSQPTIQPITGGGTVTVMTKPLYIKVKMIGGGGKK